jgi:hypothetical protein
MNVFVCRPAWDLVGNAIDGGDERWLHIAKTKTSREKLLLVVNELNGVGNDNDDDVTGSSSTHGTNVLDQLPAFGEGDHVPFHLRSSKSMKNRRLTRRDVAVLIQEIWTERRLSDKQVE